MKNLLYLIIGLLALTIVSCSKVKDDASADADILGVWQGTQWEVAGSGTIVDEGTEMDFELLMLAPYLDKEPYEVTFSPDNTTTSTRDNFTVRTNLKMLGQEFTDEMKIRSEEHTSELQSRGHLVCRLLLEKKKNVKKIVVYNTTVIF